MLKSASLKSASTFTLSFKISPAILWVLETASTVLWVLKSASAIFWILKSVLQYSDFWNQPCNTLISRRAYLCRSLYSNSIRMLPDDVFSPLPLSTNLNIWSNQFICYPRSFTSRPNSASYYACTREVTLPKFTTHIVTTGVVSMHLTMLAHTR